MVTSLTGRKKFYSPANALNGEPCLEAGPQPIIVRKPLSMNYQQSLDYLYSLTHSGIKMGLENTLRILARFNNPQLKVRTIHIAGTNGKGSTAAFMESILRAAGYRVGLYTSPHLLDFRERIQIDRQMIDKEDLAALTLRIKKASEELEIQPTFFEFATVMAFLYFYEKTVDWSVIETGLGGRLDATNVCRGEISIITSISMDHTQYLGNSVREIAAEKAEIIKENGTVIAGFHDEQIIAAINDKAFKLNVPVYQLKKNFQVQVIELTSSRLKFDYRGLNHHYEKLEVPLLGRYQAINAAMAVTAGLILANAPNILFQKPEQIKIARVEADLFKTKKEALDWALKNIRGKYRNEMTGWEIRVARRGDKHALLAFRQRLNPANFTAVRALPQLIKNAVLAKSVPDKSGAPDIAAVHTFYAPVEINGALLRAKILVNETREGKKFIDESVVEMKKEADVISLPGGTEVPSARKNTPASTMDIDQLLDGVKLEDGSLPQKDCGIQDRKIAESAIRQGLKTVRWDGRMEVVSNDPIMILDCAHNPESVKVLATALRDHFAYKRCIVVLGVMKDKPIDELIEIIGVFADHVILVKPRQKRSADPEMLRKKLAKTQKVVEIIEEIPYALVTARKISNPEDIICVTGSAFTVAEAKQSIENEGII